MTDVRLSKRNLIAATACYLLVVLILIFFVALVTAHCPSARCAARAAAQWRWGWTIALVIYPVFIWISRRAIWRPAPDCDLTGHPPSS